MKAHDKKKDVEGPLAKRGEPVKIHVRHLSVHFGGVRAAPQHFFRRKDPQKTVLRIRGDRRRIPCAPVRPRHGNAPPAELLKVYASLSTRQNISRHPGAAVRMWGAWTAADFRGFWITRDPCATGNISLIKDNITDFIFDMPNPTNEGARPQFSAESKHVSLYSTVGMDLPEIVLDVDTVTNCVHNQESKTDIPQHGSNRLKIGTAHLRR